MKLIVTPLINALAKLEKSLNFLQSDLSRANPDLHEQFRNSSIQCFEFTYELAYKMLHRQLQQIVGTTDDLRQMNFADFIRTATEAGLIPDVKRFIHYRERRNLTSHTYDERKAEEIITILDEFVRDIHFLIKELNARNEKN